MNDRGDENSDEEPYEPGHGIALPHIEKTTKADAMLIISNQLNMMDGYSEYEQGTHRGTFKDFSHKEGFDGGGGHTLDSRTLSLGMGNANVGRNMRRRSSFDSEEDDIDKWSHLYLQ